MPEKQSPEIEYSRFVELLYQWRNSSLTHLSAVIGCARLLLEGDEETGSPTAAQRELLEVLLRSAIRSISWWHIAVEYTELCYGSAHPVWERLSLYQLAEQVAVSLQSHPIIASVNVNLPEGLPFIKGSPQLIDALRYLIVPEPEIYYLRREPFSPTITARQAENGQIEVEVNTALKFSAEEFMNPSKVFYPGGALSIAELILKQYESAVHIRPSSIGVKFLFALPIWEDSE